MPRIDFSGLRNELVLTNTPTEKYPEGKDYVVSDVSMKDAQRLLEIYSLIGSDNEKEQKEGAEAFVDFLTVDGRVVSLLRRLLGSGVDEIEADGLGAQNQRDIEEAIITTALQGVEAAQAMLTAKVTAGEALARGNRATRRAAAKKSTVSSRKAGSSSTPRTGSRGTARSSSATPARTSGRASTRSRATSAPSTASRARKAG